MNKKNIDKTNSDKKIKTDRRILFTKQTLKENLLDMLTEMPFEKIGVVALCKKAYISRSAFYLHYANMEDLLKDVIRDGLEHGNCLLNMLMGEFGTENGEMKKVDDDNRDAVIGGIPLKKYNALLYDQTSFYTLYGEITQKHKDSYIKDMMKKYDLDEKEAEMIFYFQAGGCMSTMAVMKLRLTKEAKDLREMVDKILKGGIKNYISEK